MSFPAAALQRLARRIYEGDVVFFIGSGFSNDSEGNTINRMLLRLLARLRAFAEALDKRGKDGSAIEKELISTFQLNCADKDKRTLECEGGFWKLGDKYFEVNEWFCNAFGRMLSAGASCGDQSAMIDEIAAAEKHLLSAPHCLVKPHQYFQPTADTAVPEKIAPELFKLSAGMHSFTPKLAGKALFLDTLGFRDGRVMGGQPATDDLTTVAASYSQRLLPRHKVLARFAREGLCNTTLTTNFDLLLEGAFRLAGFQYRDGNTTKTWLGNALPATTYADFARLASPVQFFTDGKAHRTAVVVKMHGCADSYREAKYQDEQGKSNDGGMVRLRRYLPSLVFTYREIQNWRSDSWAADYLRTLLRTRVVVFCGYSVQDPVIHDTFRTVYEEMERIRNERGSAECQPGPADDAPAFFFSYGGPEKLEFYGQEVLRAASRAVSAKEKGDSAAHPNTVPFFGQGKGFPNLDETFQWLFHLTFRARQAESLRSDLRRITTLLLNRSAPDCELEQIRKEFEGICTDEQNRAAGTGSQIFDQKMLRSICTWTEYFHPGLLREFAAADTLHRRQGPGPELALLRHFAWYYPAMQDTSWTAWGAVVELALRRLVLSQAKRSSPLSDIDGLLVPAASHHPTLWIHREVKESSGVVYREAPIALTIWFSAFLRGGRLPSVDGSPMEHHIWEIQPGDAPWPRQQRKDETSAKSSENLEADRSDRRPAPSAEWIWRWAVGEIGEAFPPAQLTPFDDYG